MRRQVLTPHGAAYVETETIIALGPERVRTLYAEHGKETRTLHIRMMYLSGGAAFEVLDGPDLIQGFLEKK